MRTMGKRGRAPGLCAVVAAGALLGTGCSGAGEQPVFTVVTGFSNRATARTTDLVDIGMPDLHNQSGQTVKLRGMSLVSAPSSVHLRFVTGYLYDQTGELAYGLGNFVTHCRRQMPPYPLAKVVTPPHSDSRWYVELSLTFAKPGRYYLGRVKIYYTAGGQDGWQYQNLYQTMEITVHNSKLTGLPECL